MVNFTWNDNITLFKHRRQSHSQMKQAISNYHNHTSKYEETPDIENSIRDIFIICNRYLKRDLCIYELNDCSLQFIQELRKKSIQFYKQLQRIHKDKSYYYSNGVNVTKIDKMRIRMILGTLRSFFVNEKEMINNTCYSLWFHMGKTNIPIDIIHYIVSFL